MSAGALQKQGRRSRREGRPVGILQEPGVPALRAGPVGPEAPRSLKTPRSNDLANAPTIRTGAFGGGIPAVASRENRLAALAGRIAVRSANWAWWRHYERWREGGHLTSLQRRWIGVSLLWMRLEAEGKKLSLADLRKVPLWPETPR